jgi:hypothetical protein
MSERKGKRDDPQIPAAPAALPFGFAKLASKKNWWRCSRKELRKKLINRIEAAGLLLSLFFLFGQKQWLRGRRKSQHALSLHVPCGRHAAHVVTSLKWIYSTLFFSGLFFGFSPSSFLPLTSSFFIANFRHLANFFRKWVKKHENFVISNDVFPENEENHENFVIFSNSFSKR